MRLFNKHNRMVCLNHFESQPVFIGGLFFSSIISTKASSYIPVSFSVGRFPLGEGSVMGNGILLELSDTRFAAVLLSRQAYVSLVFSNDM